MPDDLGPEPEPLDQQAFIDNYLKELEEFVGLEAEIGDDDFYSEDGGAQGPSSNDELAEGEFENE